MITTLVLHINFKDTPFLWTSRGLISLEPFINFSLNLYILSWLWKCFKFLVLRLLANTFASQKIESIHFYSCTQAKLSPITPQAEGNYPFLLNSVFWRSIFSTVERGEEEYGVEKNTKIKPMRVLVTNFDKFHHICNLYIWFLFCCAII